MFRLTNNRNTELRRDPRPARRKWKSTGSILAALGGLLLTASLAAAGEASTSASAAANPFGPGTASATANFNGRGPGFARTDTRSGNNINLGRGLAFGLDRDGLSFSSSHAVAPRFGPAVAGTFNLTLGFDGSVSGSHGLSVANGSPTRSVHAGGTTSLRRGIPTAVSTAGGRTGFGGKVRAYTNSHTERPRFSSRPIRWR